MTIKLWESCKLSKKELIKCRNQHSKYIFNQVGIFKRIYGVWREKIMIDLKMNSF